MPFFLVTHTSLIEADNDRDAAEKAIEEIRTGRQVTVTVKADETTISHMTVSARHHPENSTVEAKDDSDRVSRSAADKQGPPVGNHRPDNESRVQSHLSLLSTNPGIVVLLAIVMLMGFVGGRIIS